MNFADLIAHANDLRRRGMLRPVARNGTPPYAETSRLLEREREKEIVRSYNEAYADGLDEDDRRLLDMYAELAKEVARRNEAKR